MELNDPTCKVHPTALIEEGVRIGSHSSIWDNVHIRKNAFIGDYTSIGEKTYIAYDVKIGLCQDQRHGVHLCGC